MNLTAACVAALSCNDGCNGNLLMLKKVAAAVKVMYIFCFVLFAKQSCIRDRFPVVPRNV